MPRKTRTVYFTAHDWIFQGRCFEEKAGGKTELGDYNIEFIEPRVSYSDPILNIGESIKRMAGASVAYFMHGWEKHRDCIIEHEVAVQYGIRCIMYED